MTKEKAETMIVDAQLKYFLGLVLQAKAQYYKLLSSGESPAYCDGRNPDAEFYQQQGAAAAYKQMLGTLDEFELRLKSMLDEGDVLRRFAYAAEEGRKWIKLNCPQLAKGDSND